MKKLLALMVLGLFIAPSAHAAFDTDLRYGSSGSPVLELQEFLTTQGVYSGPITGNFYSLTLAGVKALQTKLSVSPQSGYFGPLTRASANAILSNDLKESDKEASSTPVSKPVVQTTTPIGSTGAAVAQTKEYTESLSSFMYKAEDNQSFGGVIVQARYHQSDSVSVSVAGKDGALSLDANQRLNENSCSTTGTYKNMCYKAYYFIAPAGTATYTITAQVGDQSKTLTLTLVARSDGDYDARGGQTQWTVIR